MRHLVVCSALTLAACGGGTDVPPDASPVCLEAPQHSDYAWIEANVFARSCGAFVACHKGSAREAAGLNLESGMAYDALVGKNAKEHADWLLVNPGKPDESYLLVALGAAVGPMPSDGRMPLRNPPLCDEKLEAIRRWIAAGALRD
jgi:hypothetical protein